MRRLAGIAIVAALLGAAPARADGVTLQLNDVGTAGLERMLDIARRNAPTMGEADMAVSLWNALQRAREATMMAAQKNADAAEIAKLKADLDAKNAAPSTEPKP